MGLFEVAIAMSIFTFVLAGTLGLLDVSAKQAPTGNERSHAIRESQVGLRRMVGELRQAYSMVGAGENFVQFLVRLRAPGGTHVNRYVEYDCGNANPGKCVRRQTTPGNVLPSQGETVVPRVLNDQTTGAGAVFTYSGDDTSGLNPFYITVRLEVPAKGERATGHSHKIVLEDGVYARNLGS